MARRLALALGHEELQTARDAARAYERRLDPARRKELGQFFSGLRLGRILVHLSIEQETRTVLDPMAGHGDLLDAAWEVAGQRSIRLERLDGIEIDNTTAATCRDRLAALPVSNDRPESLIVAGDAFDPETVNRVPVHSYDLVITNPPYVRYQGRENSGSGTNTTRSGLENVIDRNCQDESRLLWKVLVNGYSGLADLSVPAWILAAFLVRPGGRLALIVPATWRSRDYADVIRYLLLRFFDLETVVADTQPGWFSDALVRTHLIVARRLGNDEAGVPLEERRFGAVAQWVDVAPSALTNILWWAQRLAVIQNWPSRIGWENRRGLQLRVSKFVISISATNGRRSSLALGGTVGIREWKAKAETYRCSQSVRSRLVRYCLIQCSKFFLRTRLPAI